jgi:murein DD-endopeptidase MepM/ murein hydrolase activator NlpD
MFLKRYVNNLLHFFKKKDEHLTFLIFKESGLGEVKARHVRHSTLRAFLIGTVAFLLFAFCSFLAATFLFKERVTALQYLAENQMLKSKISDYNKKLLEVEQKLISLEEYEAKIRSLTKELKLNPKYLPKGGRETQLNNLEIENNASSKAIEDKMKDVGNIKKNIEEKEKSMSELIDLLNMLKLVADSTPTALPVNGWISSGYGRRISPFGRGLVFHEGIDVSVRQGTPVKAVASGVVVYAGWQSGYGRLVVIDHGFGYQTKYAHNSVIKVKVGQRVKKGTIVSYSGNSGDSTGPHVHFEILVGGRTVDPVKFLRTNKLADILKG